MIKLKQTSPENVWYDFEDEVDFSQYEDKMVIAGNRSFKEFGDSDLIKIVKGDYYDDDKTLIENEDDSCYEDVIGYDYETAEEFSHLISYYLIDMENSKDDEKTLFIVNRIFALFQCFRKSKKYDYNKLLESFLCGFAKPSKKIVELFDVEDDIVTKIQKFAYNEAYKETNRQTYQSMEGLIHNLNTMHSRAGAQVPFSSINFGTDISLEGRMVSKNLLLSMEKGLGNGETAIFPILIFKVKEGINLNEDDPNYDLFKLSCRVSAKRLFPNFSFLDAPFNLKYYKPNNPETEATYMGCRTRVMNNICGECEVSGRGNLSFTTINLPRLGIEHGIIKNKKADLDGFFKDLDNKINLVIDQLLERMEIQGNKKVKNFPFLMGQGIWRGSDKLSCNDKLQEVIKEGTLTLGFIGLAECLIALIGKHHGESEEAQELGLKIISHMRKRMDEASEQYKLNFSLIATPAEGLSGRFTEIDKKVYGQLKGITDKEYYTNSFHVPVYYNISAYDKIKIEAPYHELTNGGHITYVELDGDTSNNLEAFETIIRAMKELGIGYGSINHPVDRDPVCGYSGVIEGDICPRCGRNENDSNIKFDRIRRITGYLVGTVDRFNDAKKAEVKDRVKHK